MANSIGSVFNHGVFTCKDVCKAYDAQCDKCFIRGAFDKLTAYENTGVAPNEIEYLKSAYSEVYQAYQSLLKEYAAVLHGADCN